MGSGINTYYERPNAYINVGNRISVNTSGSSNDIIYLPKTYYNNLTQSQWIANYPNLVVKIVVPLETPTEESITLTGDLEQVKRIRGEYAYIDAPQYTSSTEITFGQETDFPDGYEEIDFPLDDMFYYQDGEYIDFPSSWGFVMGYVFDANEIRFVMNVTKALKDGMIVDVTRSADLALNLYTGDGGASNLSGFSANYANFIPQLGQIQIRLQTTNAHGLPVGSLIGARVATGVLRIIFEEET